MPVQFWVDANKEFLFQKAVLHEVENEFEDFLHRVDPLAYRGCIILPQTHKVIAGQVGINLFPNATLLKLPSLETLHQKKKPIQFTRSRAYHKDDNAHIEQKNWTHVRQWLGYDRLDNPRVVPVLNELYTQEWLLFQNFFLPSVKLLAKERIASRTIRRHDPPKTPYQRVMESSWVTQATKKQLTAQLKTLNPFQLRTAIEIQLKKIFQVQSQKTPS